MRDVIDADGSIRVRGAREHNLRSVDVDLPRQALVAVVGVSGSGKSSLAFDTLHAEGQRRYLVALGRDAGLRRPDVTALTGLPPTIALEQRASAPSRLDTVGTVSGVHEMLALLFGRAGTQTCPTCGSEIRVDTVDEVVEALMRLADDTRIVVEAPFPSVLLGEIAAAGFSRVRVGGEIRSIEEVSATELPMRVVVDRVRLGRDKRSRLAEAVRAAFRAGRGRLAVVTDDTETAFLERPFCARCGVDLPRIGPERFRFDGPGGCTSCGGSAVVDERPCSSCRESRLDAHGRALRYEARSAADWVRCTVRELADAASSWSRTPVTSLAIETMHQRLDTLESLGLSDLPLLRGVRSLSSSERQRLRLARHVAARLSGVLYVLDEPAAGLAAREVRSLVVLLRALKEGGSTVLVVEHHPAVIEAADWVVEFGPGAGREGGRVVFTGTPEALVAADTPTGRHLAGRAEWKRVQNAPRGTRRIPDLRTDRFEPLDLELPVRGLVALRGEAASGKTTLLRALHARLVDEGERVVKADRSVVARAPRSTVATYTGLWDVVRPLLAATPTARMRGYVASTFSLNVKGGRCEACHGQGVQRIDLGALPDAWVECRVCEGRRFGSDVLDVTWKGHNADQLLRLSALEALRLLAGHPRLEAILRSVSDVGLSYLPLGQTLETLSGGEAHRLALARELARRPSSGPTFYLLDEPTRGLHPEDVAHLLPLLDRLVGDESTVVAATHDDRFAALCDAVVELSAVSFQRSAVGHQPHEPIAKG